MNNEKIQAAIQEMFQGLSRWAQRVSEAFVEALAVDSPATPATPVTAEEVADVINAPVVGLGCTLGDSGYAIHLLDTERPPPPGPPGPDEDIPCTIPAADLLMLLVQYRATNPPSRILPDVVDRLLKDCAVEIRAEMWRVVNNATRCTSVSVEGALRSFFPGLPEPFVVETLRQWAEPEN